MCETKTDNSQTQLQGIKGFKYSGVYSGVRNKGRKDLAIIYSEVPAVAAGVFTINKFKAAPVLLDQEHLHHPTARAIVINSGNANACTGSTGMANAQKMVTRTAQRLHVQPEEVLVSSTGIIGVQLDMEKIEKGIEIAVDTLSESGGNDLASAILTTDTCDKKMTVFTRIAGRDIHVGAVAKGSGMIHPNMATMLCYILTDASITKELLQDILQAAVDESFNTISVDGDTSTNDTVIALANGQAGNSTITEKDDHYFRLLDAFQFVAKAMARKIIQDGEGATKFLQVKVMNAPSIADARNGAKAVVSSNLVKAAFFGQDANWGRILCALGYSGAEFDPQQVDLFIENERGSIQLVNKGVGLKFNEQDVSALLAEKNIHIMIDLNIGSSQAMAWGCDLSYDYVKINGCYRT